MTEVITHNLCDFTDYLYQILLMHASLLHKVVLEYVPLGHLPGALLDRFGEQHIVGDGILGWGCNCVHHSIFIRIW